MVEHDIYIKVKNVIYFGTEGVYKFRYKTCID
jgi:hypothetical protein